MKKQHEITETTQAPATPSPEKYYVVSTTYVGPNQADERYCDADTITVQTTPATGNFSGKPVLEGWAGETDGWSIYGHGEYASLAEAEAAVLDIFIDVRDSDWDGTPFIEGVPEWDDYIVRLYKPGNLHPVGREATEEWAADWLPGTIFAETSDEELEEIAAEIISAAELERILLHAPSLYAFLERDRDEKTFLLAQEEGIEVYTEEA